MKNKKQKVTKGVVFTRTKLGESVFVRKNAKSASMAIRPDDWRISELRAIADYMESNPKCSLFSDGSGRICRK